MTRRTRVVLVAAVAAVALAAAVVAIALHDDTAAFHEMVAEMRAGGEPTTFEELAPSIADPTANGAADLVAADAWLTDTAGPQQRWKVVGPWNDASIQPWWETSSPEQLEELATFLDTLAPFLERVEAAVRKPRIGFATRRDPTGLPAFDHVSRVQRAQRVLSATGFAARDAATRLRAIRASALLATRIDNSALIDVMVGVAVQADAISNLRTGLEARGLDVAAARDALDGLLEHDWNARVPAVLRGECVWLIEGYQAVLEGRVSLPASPWYERLADRARGRRPTGPWPTSAEVVEACGLLREAAAAPPAPDSAYLRRVEAILTEGDSPFVQYHRFWSLLQRVCAVQRLARIALALAVYRDATGDWPASLDELVPLFQGGVPLDPYSGRAFRYERTASGVLIASAYPVAGEFGTETEREAERRDLNLLWELR